MADLKDQSTIESLNECKKEIDLRLIRASLLCECNTHNPQCDKKGMHCPFEIKGRLYRSTVYTCSVSLVALILDPAI